MRTIGRQLASLAFRDLTSAPSTTNVAIVGGGHNGLIAACLLARQGVQASDEEAVCCGVIGGQP